jgi:thiosulfate/3-mercaptopyruvate sulfurtransferase
LYVRSAPEHYAVLEDMQENHCNSCHATCGDCHVSQPFSVGGGLLDGHDFVESPSMSRNCTACHGSRVKDEYYGTHEGLSSDVHFRNRMDCMECHQADEMHGMGMADVESRYDGDRTPTCESCHDNLGMGELENTNEYHAEHDTDLMACQVCHSQSYTNCVNCHVEKTDEGVPFFSVEDHFLDFRIGYNPDQTDERPYEYVVVRHVPVQADSFSFYGDDLLPNFNDRATWLPATPHNIQRNTPQTESCDSCHGNADIWLTEDVVAEAELDANEDVIVDRVPR